MNRQEATDLVTSLFESWYSALVRYACRLTGSQAGAQDAVQQAFMDLYSALIEGQQIRYPKAWTICVLRRGIAANWEGLSETEPLSSLNGHTFASVQPDHCAGDVPKLLSYLTPREQEVLMLRMEAYKYREIAQSLGISPNSVNTLLSRAITKLQKVMKPSQCREAGSFARWSTGPASQESGYEICPDSEAISRAVKG
jgi:RNA polymerase sigma-70 factor (ECF subfamily)